MIPHDRLVAPRAHLGVLVEPPVRDAILDIQSRHDSNLPATRAPQPHAGWLDSTVNDIRRGLSRQLDVHGPVIATGHQAEFFHAGVFAKTIAADLLAASLNGSTVFVCVDSDTPKTDRLAVPTSIAGVVQRHSIPIPGLVTGLPIESQQALNKPAWAEFFDELGRVAPAGALLSDYARQWLNVSDATIVFREAIIRAQTALERGLGLSPARPLLISLLSKTTAFRAFVARIIADASGFALAYNCAKHNYRMRHRVRSPHNPIPDLQIAGPRIETPFWVLKSGGPRLRLSIEARGETLAFFADHEFIGEESLDTMTHIDQAAKPWSIEAVGWSIRPTVITLSAFCRIFLGDVFLHGIGGAKYDEITDELLASWFRVPAAPMICVTATAHVPMNLGTGAPQPPGSVRESLHHPQRFWGDLPAELVAQRARQIDAVVALRKDDRHNRSARRGAHRALKESTRQLAAHTQAQREHLAAAWERFNAAQAQRAAAADREYFFALHNRDTMSALVERMRVALGTTG